MDGIRGVEVNSSDKNLFNIWFHSTNLHWPRVTNREEAAEADGADRTNWGRVDKKKVDRPDIEAEDLGIALEDPTLKDPDITTENQCTVPKDPPTEDPGTI